MASKPAAWLQTLAHASDTAWLSAMVILGAVIRTIGLAKSSIWHDEGYTMMMVQFQPGEIWHRTGLDVHPPLYYWTLHYWTLLFGTSEAAARSLSLIYMLGAIVFGFLLVRRLFGSHSARLAALFLALAPFLVRYSQEARMYGMLAFLATAATYYLVRAFDTRKMSDFLIYGIIVAAGLYTYYYVIFMILFHWVYVAFMAVYPRLSKKSIVSTILSRQWLAANALAVFLWLPWVPTAYYQLTKIQSPPWIPKATGETLSLTFSQFTVYTDMKNVIAGIPMNSVRNLLFAGFLILVAALLWQRRKNAQPVVLMGLFAFFTPFVVWLLSFGAHPKYIDRYFVFAAVAFYAFLGILITQTAPWRTRLWLQRLSAIAICALFAVGLYNNYQTSNHPMRQLTTAISQNYHDGDALVAGDFYTFFDFTYYDGQILHSASPAQAYVPNEFPGCCEGKSMLADRPELVLKSMRDVHPQTGYVWIVGRPGAQDYFDQVPANWTRAGDHIEIGSLAAQRFQVR